MGQAVVRRPFLILNCTYQQNAQVKTCDVRSHAVPESSGSSHKTKEQLLLLQSLDVGLAAPHRQVQAFTTVVSEQNRCNGPGHQSDCRQ